MRGTIYAIGDIHGCARELEALLGRIDVGERDTLLFLGDYIDRGDDSARVIDIVRHTPLNTIALKGNHEDLMVQAHRDGPDSRAWNRWIANGGDTTLQSYGGTVPNDVLTWADALPLSHRVDDWFFVHAGVDPRASLAEQDPQTLLWIRDAFLESDADYGVRVVHGHTPDIGAVEVRTNRINLDAGCCYGGELVCGVFSAGAEPFFITASGREVTVNTTASKRRYGAGGMRKVL